MTRYIIKHTLIRERVQSTVLLFYKICLRFSAHVVALCEKKHARKPHKIFKTILTSFFTADFPSHVLLHNLTKRQTSIYVCIYTHTHKAVLYRIRIAVAALGCLYEHAKQFTSAVSGIFAFREA